VVTSESFPRTLRLLHRTEFLKVQSQGRKVVVEPLLALALPNGRGITRLGLTVSTKVGNAVVRARLRRQLREVFRKRRALLPPGLDLVLIPRQGAAEAGLDGLSRAFASIAEALSRPRKERPR
jgi:ribonuclease P protein component